jgi:hypothetical protein
MKRLPLLMDDSPSPLVRAAAYFFVPIALTLLLPILLLVILALYLVAAFHGGRFFVLYLSGKNESTEYEVQKPHFLELPASTHALPDESRDSLQG